MLQDVWRAPLDPWTPFDRPHKKIEDLVTTAVCSEDDMQTDSSEEDR